MYSDVLILTACMTPNVYYKIKNWIKLTIYAYKTKQRCKVIFRCSLPLIFVRFKVRLEQRDKRIRGAVIFHVRVRIEVEECVKFIGCYDGPVLKSSENVCGMDMPSGCERYLEFLGAFLQ